MSSPLEIYPFSTQDGQSIPFDALKPIGLYICNILGDTPTSYTLNSKIKLASIISTVDAFLSFEDDLTDLGGDGVEHKQVLFIPSNTIVTTVFPSNLVILKGLVSSGTMYIQALEKWVSLGLEKQYVRK